MKRKVQKFPLLYSFAQEALLEELKGEQDKNASRLASNKIADQFLKYINSIESSHNYNNAKSVNETVFTQFESGKQKSSKEQAMRHFLQALSFNLTTQQALEIFPKTMNAELPSQEGDIKKTGKELYEEMIKTLHGSN